MYSYTGVFVSTFEMIIGRGVDSCVVLGGWLFCSLYYLFTERPKFLLTIGLFQLRFVRVWVLRSHTAVPVLIGVFSSKSCVMQLCLWSLLEFQRRADHREDYEVGVLSSAVGLGETEFNGCQRWWYILFFQVVWVVSLPIESAVVKEEWPWEG